MLTPLHVCFTWVTVNIYLCKYWRPVILIFVYANIYTGILVVGYHTSGTTSWQCSLPPRVTASAEKGQNQPKKYLTVGLNAGQGKHFNPSGFCDTRAGKSHSRKFDHTLGRVYLGWRTQSFPKFFAGIKYVRQITLYWKSFIQPCNLPRENHVWIPHFAQVFTESDFWEAHV